MAKGFSGISVGRSVGMLFFWITPLTCVSSIFLFAFGVSLLSYFLTGNEYVTAWEVLKLMETLPDPREFISDCLLVYNNIQYWGAKIPMQTVTNISSFADVLKVLYNGFFTVIKLLISLWSFVATMLVSIIMFPIYCVFFTIRTCGAFLTVLGVNGVNNMSLDWKVFGWLNTQGNNQCLGNWFQPCNA